jgi:hypothetical protein
MICKSCQSEFDFYSGTGRIPEYCSNACRQAHYRLRKNDFQHKRVFRRLANLMTVNGPGFRNVNDQAKADSAGAGVYRQVDWTS